ncbi:hypothetical protein D6817_03650 [Candidatus Pacearchaeota archaeon]|nr:MAG: hypothetical protein D6817_03650 [Candidatus Pacearchaeota archaeon]
MRGTASARLTQRYSGVSEGVVRIEVSRAEGSDRYALRTIPQEVHPDMMYSPRSRLPSAVEAYALSVWHEFQRESCGGCKMELSFSSSACNSLSREERVELGAILESVVSELEQE